jgi:hypothetical protein
MTMVSLITITGDSDSYSIDNLYFETQDRLTYKLSKDPSFHFDSLEFRARPNLWRFLISLRFIRNDRLLVLRGEAEAIRSSELPLLPLSPQMSMSSRASARDLPLIIKSFWSILTLAEQRTLQCFWFSVQVKFPGLLLFVQ